MHGNGQTTCVDKFLNAIGLKQASRPSSASTVSEALANYLQKKLSSLGEECNVDGTSSFGEELLRCVRTKIWAPQATCDGVVAAVVGDEAMSSIANLAARILQLKLALPVNQTNLCACGDALDAAWDAVRAAFDGTDQDLADSLNNVASAINGTCTASLGANDTSDQAFFTAYGVVVTSLAKSARNGKLQSYAKSKSGG
jgi:hypothetical protein